MFFFKVFAWASRMQLRQPCQIDLPEGRKVSLLVQKRSFKKNIFVKKSVFLGTIPWTSIKQFSQHFLKVVSRMPKSFLSISKKDKRQKVFRKKRFSSKCFSGHVKWKFAFPVPITSCFLRESRKFFAQYPKQIKNHKILNFSLLLQKVFWTLQCSFDKPS